MLLSTTIAQELDSLKLESDSIFSDDPILKKIESFAEDSIDYDLMNNKVRLYHNAKIIYDDIELEAAFIQIDSEKNTVFATSLLDSLGQDYGFPFFKEKDNSFSSKEITYNFKTKKGIIKEVITQEGESYIHGNTVKKNQDDVVYTLNGKYTTCDHEEPHFSIRAKKIKTIPNSKIITGPAVLEFSGVPVPIALPFGYFSNQKKQSSGLIFPVYGESKALGFFLRNGGYYLAINDKIDLSLTGNIYSKGSWGINTISNYKKRYKYNGSFNISYASIKSGSEIYNNLSDKRDFFVRWNHRQDPKASKDSKFSANINAGSSSYHQNNSYSDNEYLSNTFQSSISYSKSFSFSNLALNFRHNQNTLNNKVNLSLPELNYSVNRFYPLQFINQKSTAKKWYNKIGVSYSANAKNQISTIDSLLFLPSTLSNFQNGVIHRIPVSTSFKTLKYINISPKFNYTERWYFDRLEKKYSNNEITTDTLSSFNRVYDYNINLNASTKLYGLYNFKGEKIKALRHIITPSLSLSYKPDFSKEKYNYYSQVQSDSIGNTITYSNFQNGIYGTVNQLQQGNISLNISNILEMKVKTKNDSTKSTKKVKILDNLNIQSSYNIFADSLNFSTIKIGGRTKLFKHIDLSFNSSYDPYITNSNNIRINKFYFSDTYLPGRFINSSARLSFRLNGGKNEEKYNNWEQFIDFDIPWSLNVNYTANYNKYLALNQLSQSLNFSGNLNLTEKWKIGFNSGYDFIFKDLTYTSLDFYRDLHCWEMSFKWIPFGLHQSYNFSIRVKASVLQDLKWEKKKDWYDYN